MNGFMKGNFYTFMGLLTFEAPFQYRDSGLFTIIMVCMMLGFIGIGSRFYHDELMEGVQSQKIVSY